MTAGFPPIAGKEARLLILGTMPSVKSQEKRQYYGHPQNAFWPILYALWERPLEADYGRRCRFLLDQDIALWDVLARCAGREARIPLSGSRPPTILHFRRGASPYPGRVFQLPECRKAV